MIGFSLTHYRAETQPLGRGQHPTRLALSQGAVALLEFPAFVLTYRELSAPDRVYATLPSLAGCQHPRIRGLTLELSRCCFHGRVA